MPCFLAILTHSSNKSTKVVRQGFGEQPDSPYTFDQEYCMVIGDKVVVVLVGVVGVVKDIVVVICFVDKFLGSDNVDLRASFGFSVFLRVLFPTNSVPSLKGCDVPMDKMGENI
jgi:hypothetical protein